MDVLTDHGVRRGRKFDQVLEGARKIFLRDGFERAAVDDIAREAGVSKATIYAYFPDKQLMFLEVARVECLRQTEAAEAAIDPALPVRAALMIVADRIAAFQMSEFGQRMFRIVVGEGARFPGLAQQYHATGMGLIHGRLVQHLRHHMDKGDLVIADPDLAAEQFVQLCKAGLQERLLFGMGDGITPDAVERSVRGAVDMFMARYGVPG
jgi:TetR/AcrR family transcriptional repressor of mexJK operon